MRGDCPFPCRPSGLTMRWRLPSGSAPTDSRPLRNSNGCAIIDVRKRALRPLPTTFPAAGIRTYGRRDMAGENEGMDRGDPSEDGREFHRMMDALGREGINLMIGRLSEKVDANPQDTESLSLRGLLHSQLGEHRRAAEGLRPGHRPGPRRRRGPPGPSPRLLRAGGAPAGPGGLRRRRPAGAGRRLGPFQPGGPAAPTWATWPGRWATSTWPSCWTRGMPRPTTTGA